MLKPVVQPRGGEIAHSPGAPRHQPPDLVATPGGRVGPGARPRPPARQGRPGECLRAQGSGVEAVGTVGPGGRDRQSCTRGCGPRREPARPVPGQGRVWQEGTRGRGRSPGRGARGTHQLQRTEADKRAAPGATAHGAGGVRAALAARDPRPPAPLPPDSGAVPARRSPGPARGRRSQLWGSGLAHRLC